MDKDKCHTKARIVARIIRVFHQVEECSHGGMDPGPVT